MVEQFLTVQQVAEYLSISENTVYRLVHQKNGLKAFKIGRAIRFRPSDIEAYLEAQEIKPPEPASPFGEHFRHFKYVPGMKIVEVDKPVTPHHKPPRKPIEDT